MKSYEERLPLIDAAIDELKGEFPPTAIGYSGRGYYAKGDFANILHGVNIGDICTRDEFEQRKAELAAKEQEMNDWYEKGELPPVGEICKLVSQGMTLYGFDVEITYIGDGVGCYKRLKDSREFTFASGEVVFRPLRTETDKLVDEAMSLFSQTEAASDAKQGIEHAVHKLIEQGYRKAKPMSEQEFMKQCVDICGHGDARLYRAGCRFIEQVKV